MGKSKRKFKKNSEKYIQKPINLNKMSKLTKNRKLALEKLDKDSVLLLDTRTTQEHKAGTIPGSINIPVDELRQNLDTLEPYRDKDIVVYCRSGQRSYIAARILMQNGFNKVKNLSGGYLTWSSAIV